MLLVRIFFTVNFYIQFIVFGILLQIFFFKPKYYYEDDNAKKQNKRFKGGALIISNHRSFLDGIVIALKYFLKRFHFISEDFFKERFKIVKVIAQSAGSVFIDGQISDFDFIEDCKKLFDRGRPIIIFPEGGFQRTFEPSKFYTGYVLLAVKTGTKIVPIANDFQYGLFKRTHLMIGNTIDLSEYSNSELTREIRKEINKKVNDYFMLLFYQLKKKKAEKFSFKYDVGNPKKGDVIRIKTDSGYHYGIFFNENEVVQFGNAENKADEEAIVNSVSLKDFCGETPLEVRISKKRFLRKVEDIKKYAKSCLGQGRYNAEKNNCLDFVNRVTLKI